MTVRLQFFVRLRSILKERPKQDVEQIAESKTTKLTLFLCDHEEEKVKRKNFGHTHDHNMKVIQCRC